MSATQRSAFPRTTRSSSISRVDHGVKGSKAVKFPGLKRAARAPRLSAIQKRIQQATAIARQPRATNAALKVELTAICKQLATMERKYLNLRTKYRNEVIAGGSTTVIDHDIGTGVTSRGSRTSIPRFGSNVSQDSSIEG